MSPDELIRRHDFLCELRDVRIISDDVKEQMTAALLDEWANGV